MDVRAQIVSWLKQHATEPRKALSFFTGGGFLFAGGLMIILLVQKLMPASAYQELFALIGLIFVACGGAVALWGYLGISLFKVIVYILEPRKKDE